MKRLRELLASYVEEDEQHVPTPAKVEAALAVDFGVQISAYLVCAAVEGLCIAGIVFGDLSGRFENGRSIRTSMVLSSENINGYVVITTLNSCYVICDWAPEDSGPRFTGVRH